MRRQLATLGTAICLMPSTVLLTACGGGPAAIPPPPCIPSFVYSAAQTFGVGFDVVDQESETNAGSTPVTYSLTSQHGRAISIEETTVNGFSIGAQVDEAGLKVNPVSTKPLSAQASQAVFNYVHQTDSSVRETFSVQAGAQVCMTVPPGATGYALYGAFVKVTRGTLQASGCTSVTQNGIETYLVPISYHYCTWTRGPDVFTIGGQVPSSCGTIVAYDSGQ
jgi:hypothetical protein